MSYEKPDLKLIEIHEPLTKPDIELKEISVPESVKRFIGNDKHWPLLIPYFEEPKGIVVAIKQKPKSS